MAGAVFFHVTVDDGKFVVPAVVAGLLVLRLLVSCGRGCCNKPAGGKGGKQKTQ